jgi:hypothetical protein
MIEKSYLVMADDSNGIMSLPLWVFMDDSSQQPAAGLRVLTALPLFEWRVRVGSFNGHAVEGE